MFGTYDDPITTDVDHFNTSRADALTARGQFVRNYALGHASPSGSLRRAPSRRTPSQDCPTCPKSGAATAPRARPM